MKNYYTPKDMWRSAFQGAMAATAFWLVLLCKITCSKTEPVEVVKENIAVHPLSNVASNDAGRSVEHMTQEELYTSLSVAGFRNLEGYSLHDMRRVYLAWHYKPLFEAVSKNTDIAEAVIFAFFIVEATIAGVESDLFLGHWNPGGIKYRGMFAKTLKNDDCYENGVPVPCAFESMSSADEAVQAWSAVFNSGRYDNCKAKPITETCKCLQKNGYHTANDYRRRSRIAETYWQIVSAHFPSKP